MALAFTLSILKFTYFDVFVLKHVKVLNQKFDTGTFLREIALKLNVPLS